MTITKQLTAPGGPGIRRFDRAFGTGQVRLIPGPAIASMIVAICSVSAESYAPAVCRATVSPNARAMVRLRASRALASSTGFIEYWINETAPPQSAQTMIMKPTIYAGEVFFMGSPSPFSVSVS